MKPTSLPDISSLMQLQSDSKAIVHGIAVDSRLIKRGDLFFALPGDQTDGHSFLADVAAKGAVGAVVKKGYSGPHHGLEVIASDDVLKSLQELARAYLRKNHPKVIAITGSLGKTTTKEFLGHLLKVKYRVSISPGNSNSQIGLPLAILNHSQPDDEILILEMGMTHPDQIKKLVEIAPPTVAVVTTVALVHACNFNSLADIARAKAEIFSHSETEMGFYNLESDYEGALSSSGKCAKKSISSANVESMIQRPLPLPGNHNKYNFLVASTVAKYFGLTDVEIDAAVPSLNLPERRLQHIEKFGVTFVNDSYNASEKSMIAALDSLPTPQFGSKRIAVFGEMLELGKFSAECHRAVGEHSLKNIDLMFCFGTESRHIYECWQKAGRPVFWAQERAEVVEALRSALQPGDVVLLKGSRSKGVWKVLEEL